MAKTHIKVRLVPESNLDSKFILREKPTKGEKAKDKLKLKKYNPNTRKHEFLLKKSFLRTVNNYFFLKFLYSYSMYDLIIVFHIFFVILGSPFLLDFYNIFYNNFNSFLSTISFLNLLFFKNLINQQCSFFIILRN